MYRDIVSETRFEEMKRYVRFGTDEAAAVAAFGVRAAPSFPGIVEEFYQRIREHEDAHAVFTDEAQIARLQSSMLRWLTRLCGGLYDDSYFAETMKIGQAHIRVGLPQRYMFSAMALIRVALNRIADREMGAVAPRVREALGTLLDLELATILDSYRDHFVTRIQHVESLEKDVLARSLVQAGHRYKSAVELARVMIIGLDAQGEIQLFNREAERVTGYGREEAIGQRFLDLINPGELHAEDRARMAGALADIVTKSPVVDGVVSTRAGHVRLVRWQLATNPSDAVDEVVHFAIGHDTTEESALADRNSQNGRLAAVGTLAAGLAHEIRNPLNGAQLHVSYLKRSLTRSRADAELVDAVSAIGDEIQRLAKLVTEFLEFARPGRLTKKPVSMRSLCERSLGLVSSQAAAQNIAVRDDLPSQDVELHGDPEKLEQALQNLLQNALEAASSGGSAITLRARRQPRHVTLEVEDDGPGLARPDAPIFDAFFTTKPSGTGLGLPIVHRIVTDHSGTVDVESRPGRTVFRVTLPVDGSGGVIMAANRTGET